MILGYQDKRTRAFSAGSIAQAFAGFSRQAYKRFEILDAAGSVEDLRGLPSNRLEALRGDRKGQFSIRINTQWRICFEWPRGASGPSNIEIVDYHSGAEATMPRPAIHPGEILADELAELGVTPTELSRQIKVPANRVTQIIRGSRGITGDTALRLGHWFRTSPQFWLNLQAAYDVRMAETKSGKEVAALPTRAQAAE